MDAGKGDKHVRLPQLPHDGHAILVELLQIPRAAGEARPEDDALPQTLNASMNKIIMNIKNETVKMDQLMFVDHAGPPVQRLVDPGTGPPAAPSG